MFGVKRKMATINTYLVTTSKHDIPGLRLAGRLYKGGNVRAYIYIRGLVSRDKLPRCIKMFKTPLMTLHVLREKTLPVRE